MRASSSPSDLAWGVAVCAVIALSLVGYGAFLTPSASRLSVAAAAAMLIAYAAIGLAVIPRVQMHNLAVVEVAKWAGVAAGIVFAMEVCLEYVFLPKDNTSYGLIEFGLVFFIYACAGAWLTFTRHRLRDSMLGSALAAVVSSLIWCIFILATFYLFNGTSRQDQVFRAEGDFDDFRRSGMHDFRAFILEDFCGATFFHLLLGPAIASLLGLLAGLCGNGLARLTQRTASENLL